MTRQYIGARYVPIFFDGAQGTEWLPNTQYEPLTIVTRNGNSYTSKKAVPAAIGAPENNAAYWASTGIYNAQVEEIREAVNDLDERVTADIATLESDTDLNLSAVAANGIAFRRFIILGDSYGNRVNSENKTFFDLTKQFLGVEDGNWYHNHIGGAAFAHETAGYKYLDLLQALAPSVPTHRTITDIIVQCGANDLRYTADDTRAAIATFMNYVKSTFVRAKVTIFPCGLVFKRQQMQQRINAINGFKYGTRYGAALYGPAEFILEDPHLLESDLTHPAARGIDAIARGLTNAILGMPVETSFRYLNPTVSSVVFMARSGMTCSNLESHYIEANRNGVVMTCNNSTTPSILFTASESITLNRLEEIRITVDKTLLCLPDSNSFDGVVSVGTGASQTFIPAYIAVATMDDANVLRVFPKVSATNAATSFGVVLNFAASISGSMSS